MKRWFGLLLALLLLVVAATPALADGPYGDDPFHFAHFPFWGWEGMALGFLRGIVTALGLAVLGALIVIFLPAQTKQVRETALNAALPSLGVGCLTTLAALPLFVLLILLIITIPVALILPIAIVAAWLFGWIALGWLIGERVLEAVQAQESLRAPVIAAAIGVLMLSILSVVPLVGALIGLGVGLVGLGAVILTRFGTRTYPSTTPMSPATPVTTSS